MKYKTLFRLLLKAVGVTIVGIAIPWLASKSLFFASRQFGALNWWSIASIVQPTLLGAFGLYLFLGGKWIVDKAIPSNRPYCHECGYDLTGAVRNRCPECDTPFQPEDVRAPTPPDASE